MKTKTISRLEVKSGAEGIVVARFATLGVVDLDGDIVLPGAIGTQDCKVSSYGHGSWSGSLPPGIGRTYERGDEALAELSFFMDTQHGRDHFETIKGLGDLAEYSFGFDILESADPTPEQAAAGAKRVLKRLKVFEVSPVLRGAGIGTGTVLVKTCTSCGTDVKPEEIASEVAKARKAALRADRLVRGHGPILGDPDFFAQSDPAAADLARFAVKVAHGLALLPGLGRMTAPDVCWFPSAVKAPGRTLGYVVPRRNVVWLALDLRGRELVSVALHEVRHLAQDARGLKFTEPEAEAFADEFTDAVFAAYRWSNGDHWKVTHRRTPPPWPDAEGLVVLHRRSAWIHNSRNKGASWTSL